MLELVNTTETEMFIPVMQDIADDFGDQFLLAMLHWCGIGQRPTDLDLWKVFLVRAQGDTVGVAGLYRQLRMSQTVSWVGWFAIRPRFQRQGFGTHAMYALYDSAQSIGSQELWVYTGKLDHIAVSFYKSLSFEVLGPAYEWARGRTMEDTDIVLRRTL